MSFIKNTFKLTRIELLYQFYSKLIFIFFILLLLLSILNMRNLVSSINHNYDVYQKVKQSHIENGLDIQSELKSEINITRDGNSVIVDNTLKHDYMNLAISINNIKSKNIISVTLEYITFVFCTFIFSIYGIYIGTYDYSKLTMKLKTVNYTIIEIIVGKLISIFISIFIVISFVLLITYISSFALPNFIDKAINIKEFELDIFKYNNNIIIQFIFSFLISCYFGALGFLTGTLLKNTIIPCMIFSLYGFFIPILGKFDIRNIFSSIAHTIFSFKGKFVLFEPIKINNTFGIFFVNFILILLFIITTFILNKRSRFK